MNAATGRVLAGLAAGLLFGLGLSVSRMVDPDKVLAFLNVAGPWDPSLALVMLAATVVATVGYRFALRDKPLFDETLHLPTRSDIDAQLLTGSAVFGLGWGLAGYCPGPAVAALGGGGEEPVYFLVALVAGSLVASPFAHRRHTHVG
jgi:uncharacterized membrane protein YedE/YeeE